MTVVSFNASNSVSALKLRPLSFGKSPLSSAVLFLIQAFCSSTSSATISINSSVLGSSLFIDTTFLYPPLLMSDGRESVIRKESGSIFYTVHLTPYNPMYIGKLYTSQELFAEAEAVAVTKSAEGGAVTFCRRSFHRHPHPIGRVEIYCESRTLSI